jgi:hypothetical protein
VGQVNVAAAINNYFSITGVQLEGGSVATEFEFIPFDLTLHRCKRYFQKNFKYATTPAQNIGINQSEHSWVAILAGALADRGPSVYFNPIMRDTPTVVLFNPAAANAEARDATAGADCTATSFVTISEVGFFPIATGAAGTAVGNRLAVNWTADVRL